MQNGTPPSEAVDSKNNQPHIVVITNEDADEDKQYFIAVEQSLLIKSDYMVSVVFLLLAAHYCFNMDYHPKVKDLMTFIANRVARIPLPDRFKWSALVGVHVAGITRQYEADQETTPNNLDYSDSQ